MFIQQSRTQHWLIRGCPWQPPRSDPDSQMASEPTLSSLAALAASSSTVDDEAYSADPSSSSGAPKTKEQLRRHYIRSLHKVVDEADIIVLVLDARDPEGCRSRLVEEEVRRREAEGKRLVFVLNKVGEYILCFPHSASWAISPNSSDHRHSLYGGLSPAFPPVRASHLDSLSPVLWGVSWETAQATLRLNS